MQISKVLVLSVVIAATGLLTNCKTRMIDFTIISTKNVDISEMAKYKRGTTRIEGIDNAWMILFIPTGAPTMKQAIDNAIQKVPGAVALVDGVVYQDFLHAILIARFGFIVEGTPVIDPKLAAASPVQRKSDYMIVMPNKKTGESELYYLNKTDYLAAKQAMLDHDHETAEQIILTKGVM
jgi:hypothetical protein